MPTRTLQLPSWPTPLYVAALLLVVQAAATLPGELISDSRDQLQQAISHHYTDWHPPVMAYVWSWLLKLGGYPGSLLILHQCLHWLGFALIADGCYRMKMRQEAWLIVLVGAFPLFLFYDRVLLKDVGMGSALVAGVGIVVWFLIQAKSIPRWAVLLSGICILYGGLIRTNAIFALGPILCLYILGGRQLGVAKIVAWSILVVPVAVPISNWINHALIGAKQEYPVQSLQIFDLMGIAVQSGDNRVWGDTPPAMSEIRKCYTSYWWDPVSPWGSCPALRQKIGFSDDLDTTDPQSVSKVSQLWRRAIIGHPLAYLVHRAEHFNSSIYFLVPAMHFRYSKSAELGPLGAKAISKGQIHLDYLKRNLFFWPVFWLAVGVCALALIGFSADVPVVLAIARLMILSGLLFSGGYLLVGVATDERYHYWSTMAILLGVILAARKGASVFSEHRLRVGAAACCLLLVVLLGYAARIADIGFL